MTANTQNKETDASNLVDDNFEKGRTMVFSESIEEFIARRVKEEELIFKAAEKLSMKFDLDVMKAREILLEEVNLEG